MRIPASLGLLARLALLAPVLGAAACAGNPAPEATAAEGAGPQAGVEVRNLGFADMTLYAISSTGSRVRLGTVNGNSTQRLELPEYLVRGGNTMRFLADPIGGTRTPVSEELFVAPGETVTLTIPPR